MYKIGDWIPIAEYLKLPLATSGVYILRNKVNGKEYVGKSVDVRYRVKTHLVSARKDYKNAIYKAFTKYGIENFEVCIFLTGTSAEILELEVLLIEERATFTPGGYNLTLGGEGAAGLVPSVETRRKLSEASVGRPKSEETRARMAKANMNRVWSQEEKSAVSLRHTGKVLSADTRRLISVAAKGRVSPKRLRVTLDLHGVVKEFDSTMEAALFLGVSQPAVSSWCSAKKTFSPDLWKPDGSGNLIRARERGAKEFKTAPDNYIRFT